MTGKFLAISESELETYITDSKLLELRLDTETDEIFNIDRTWDALAYLVSGPDTDKAMVPLTWFIFGNQTVDESQDLGYGPARYLAPAQVTEVHEELKAVSVDDLKLKYDPALMNELNIYPGFWDNEPESFDYIASHYESLKDFYSTLAGSGHAVIMFIS
jgi:hypothetical protein